MLKACTAGTEATVYAIGKALHLHRIYIHILNRSARGSRRGLRYTVHRCSALLTAYSVFAGCAATAVGFLLRTAYCYSLLVAGASAGRRRHARARSPPCRGAARPRDLRGEQACPAAAQCVVVRRLPRQGATRPRGSWSDASARRAAGRHVEAAREMYYERAARADPPRRVSLWLSVWVSVWVSVGERMGERVGERVGEGAAASISSRGERIAERGVARSSPLPAVASTPRRAP